jgi:hypothetical protein
MWAVAVPAQETDGWVESAASRAQQVAISIYDQGFALISEMRRITPARGENQLRFAGLPRGLDPVSVSFIPLAGATGIDVLEQRYVDDLASSGTLLRSYLGRSISLQTQHEQLTGTLLRVEGWRDDADEADYLVLETSAGVRLFVNAEEIAHVTLPDARLTATLEPMLFWRVRVDQEGPQNIRLSYRVDDLSWQAVYDVILNEEGTAAYFGGRIVLENHSAGKFEGAQVQLVSTERGQAQDQRRSDAVRPLEAGAALRYAYGAAQPDFEEAVAGPAPVAIYPLGQSVTLDSGEQLFVHYVRRDDLPVDRFFVYDGVRFDRFQRHRRNDWNYGTESHEIVEAHMQFANDAVEGLGMALPPGRFRLYQQRRDGSIEFIGEDHLLATAADKIGHVRLGPARGLRGERERVGYTEVTPLRVYEESFQITVENMSEEEAEIRVVEHLYRWHDFEIVRADAEHIQTGPQTIEFRPVLRPGGRRTIHYTVRYSW